MKKRIVRTTLLVGFVAGAIALVSTIAMAHGGAGMMGTYGDNDDQAPCQDNEYSGSMHHGYGGGMMGQGMMGYGGMGSMMGEGYGGHMMNDEDMGHGSVLNQAAKLGLSDDQVSQLRALRLAERKDIIRDSAEANVVHVELSNLLSSDNWTMTDAQPLVQKLEKIEGDIHLRHLQAQNDARKILTPDQLKLYSSTELAGGGDYCD